MFKEMKFFVDYARVMWVQIVVRVILKKKSLVLRLNLLKRNLRILMKNTFSLAKDTHKKYYSAFLNRQPWKHSVPFKIILEVTHHLFEQ